MIVLGLPPDTLACRLYGSYARGEMDELSDIDLLVVIDRFIGESEQSLIQVPGRGESHLSVSLYSYQRMQDLWSCGDLFAWHLYRESRSVSGASMDALSTLGQPLDYSNGLDDIDQLITLLQDGVSSLRRCPANLVYEAGILYVCCRNIALCASWYTSEGLCFSRYSPYLFQHRTGIEFGVDSTAYESLLRSRLMGTRNVNWSGLEQQQFLISQAAVLRWSQQVREFVARQK